MNAAVAKIKLGGSADHVGTAWLCSREHALTAAHCVCPRGGVAPHAGPFSLDLAGTAVKVLRVQRFDLGLDAALLSLATDQVPAEVRPIPLAAPPAGLPPDVMRWSADGFPQAHGPGLRLTGYVGDVSGTVGTHPAIQLHCDQGGLGELKGASGSPVCCQSDDGEAVSIGLVRYGILLQRVIFATPIAEIAKAFPEVGAVVARSPRREFQAFASRGKHALSPAAAAIWEAKVSMYQRELATATSSDKRFSLMALIADALFHLGRGPALPDALSVWQQKLRYFEEQLAITSDLEERFALERQIGECREMARRLTPRSRT